MKKTYIGYAKKQGGNDVFFHPCYVLENGKLRKDKELKAEKLTGDSSGLQGLIRAEVDDEHSKPVYHRFPNPEDDWLYVIELNQTIESLKTRCLTTPLSKAAFYPPNNTEVLIFSKMDKEFLGPVRIREEKQDEHRVLRLVNSSKQTVQVKSVDFPGYHLRVAPKTVSTPPPTPAESTEITKAIIRWIIKSPVSDIFLEPPVPDERGDGSERALDLLQRTAKLQKDMLDVYRELYEASANSENATPWLHLLHSYMIPEFIAKLDSIGNMDTKCAANAADYKRGCLFLSHAAEILKCKDSTQLYEYYCLLRIVKLLTTQLGFEKTEVQRACYKTVKGTKNLANMLHFKQEDREITLYREPEISGEKCENGLFLYRRFADVCCRPDFVLKLTTKNRDKGDSYMILDSKFNCEQDKGTGEDQLAKTIDKYFLQLGTIHKNDSIAMVWILQGGNSCPSRNSSSLEKMHGPFPSFGSCIVNEHVRQGVETFRNVFDVLLETLAASPTVNAGSSPVSASSAKTEFPGSDSHGKRCDFTGKNQSADSEALH